MFAPRSADKASGTRMILRLYNSCNETKWRKLLICADRRTQVQNLRYSMLRLSLALSSLSVLLISTAAYSQSLAKPNRSINETGARDVNAKAIAALRRLDEDVIVYRSLAEFEDGRKLARVSLR